MRKISTLSTLLAALLCGAVAPSYADTLTSTSGSSSTSSSGSTAIGLGGNSSSGATAINGPTGSGNATSTTTTVNNNSSPIPTHTYQEVSGTQTLKNTPAVSAPPLTTTLTETCMGSTSGGFSIAGFGATLGGTWSDVECVNRLNARELRSMGENAAAKEVLCENPVVRAAFQKTGKPCVGDASAKVSAAPAESSVAIAQPAPQPSQPIQSSATPAEPPQQIALATAGGDPQVKSTTFGGRIWDYKDGNWVLRPGSNQQ